MRAITVNELIEKLQKIVIENEQNGILPCYIFPEGGQDILEKWEIQILDAERDRVAERDIPKRLQIG
jgi:hypothetical protein